MKKIPMRTIIVIFTIAIFFCSLFLFSGSATHPKSPYYEYNERDFGRILGISEAVKDFYGDVRSENVAVPVVNTKTRKRPILSGDVPSFDTQFNVLAMDEQSGNVLYASNAREQVPIASITKLATAMVLLDTGLDWDSIVTIEAGDRVEGGRIYVYNGDRVAVRDLFYISLVASANTATKALVRASGLAEDEFVDRMNEKMVELGINSTSFFDPIGLSNKNVSTAMEVAKLARAALSKTEIAEATTHGEFTFLPIGGKTRKVEATDSLLSYYSQDSVDIIGGKTGFTEMAGYCFTGEFSNDEGNKIITVVLGGDTYTSRFSETKSLVNWAFENYEWR